MSDTRQMLLPGSKDYLIDPEQAERVEFHLAHASSLAHWIPELDVRVIKRILLHQGLYWCKVVKVDYVKCKTRICWSPVPVMRNVHRTIRELLKWRSGFPAMAFNRGDSTLLNARCHLENRSSYMVDLTNA
ncbi:MAG: hypothetical protein V1895_01985 [Parcubacteria group bacterium]